MDLAYTSIAPIYERSNSEDRTAQKQAIDILSRLRYGENGYIFGYDDQAVRVFQGSDKKGWGKRFWDTQDPNGVYVIRDLIKAGQSGCDFVAYM